MTVRARPASASARVDAEVGSDLAALEPEWYALWSASTRATPFESPAWLMPWWHAFGRGTPRVATLRRAGRLAALLPCYLGEGGVMRAVGVGVSDRLDVIGDDRVDAADAALLLSALAGCADSRCIDLVALPADSPLLGATAPAGWRASREPDETCTTIALPIELSPRISYYRRHLERAHAEPPPRIVRVTEAGALPAALDALAAVHTARWESQGEPGVLADRAVTAFHREAAARLLAGGVLRLYLLEVHGAVTAAYYGLAAKGRAFAYITGFDPAWARFNVGTLVLAHAAEEAAREGARELDFLRGREPYKYAWGARDRLTWRLRLERTD
ncbi:MAG TPA: GNAT family N-acetyltransferase [Gemmatimonadales bacterium]|nr:GNAT family N-acetyltransferase [Gemmatimonadales bacterium]